MRTLLKKILYSLPLSVRVLGVRIRELYWFIKMQDWEKKHYPNLPKSFKAQKISGKKNILIYHINGLTFAGTEKNLQLIANSLADTSKVFYMYGDKTAETGRKETMNKNITFIPFSYAENEIAVPHKLTEMKPHLKEVLYEKEIDLIIVATPGYSHYPWNIITEIPILVSNVFGAPSLQKNIAGTIFMSDTVRQHACKWTGERPTYHTHYLPIGKEAPENVRDLGALLRQKLAIPKNDFVFGRIGRADNAIFDPIGIRAWQKIADNYPNAHYLIMSPPPILIDIVENEKIPRVHFLPTSSREEDVWAFHGALDCFAHFRKDGETSGVAIAESLIIGNPVISHRSSIWNAHLEYLDEACALIADIDDIDMYAQHMKNFIGQKEGHVDTWEKLKLSAKKIGADNFSPNTYAEKIRNIISEI